MKEQNRMLHKLLLGFLIGLAVIVPGVSGATFAIIFRLYDQMIDAISQFFRHPKKSSIFFFPILLGGIIGILLGLLIVKKVLESHFLLTISLFTGLMMGSYPTLLNQAKVASKRKINILLFGIGVILPLLLSYGSMHTAFSHQTIENISCFTAILLGIIIAATQLLPGLSATALLLTLGYFQPLLASCSFSYWHTHTNILWIYGALLFGFIIGFLTISKLLKWFFTKTGKTLYYLFAGLSLASIVTMFYNVDTLTHLKGSLSYPVLLGGLFFLFLGIGIGNLLNYYEKKGLSSKAAEIHAL